DCNGKIVYLQFNNPTCSLCRFMIRKIENEVLPSFAGNPDVVFVQIAYAYGGYDVDDVISMIDATDCSQNVLAEDNGSTYVDYSIASVPYNYVIDADGIIRYARGGQDTPSGEIVGIINGLLGGEPPPPPPPPPSCPTLALNAEEYQPGDEVRIVAEVVGIYDPFDAYVLIKNPEGLYLSITTDALRQGVFPLATNMPSHIPSASYELLNAHVPPEIVAGEYEVIAILTSPGTLDAFCEVKVNVMVR
ncbi:MAG: hypothetical protein P8123_07175, partial [bacterium]